jgi:hypothetical protein
MMKLSELELDHPTEGSGQFVNLSVMIMPVENGAELAVITVHDVTEQTQLKKRSRQSRASMLSLLAN